MFLKSQSVNLPLPKNEPKIEEQIVVEDDTPSKPKPPQKKGFMKGDEMIIDSSSDSGSVSSPTNNGIKNKNYYVLDGGE